MSLLGLERCLLLSCTCSSAAAATRKSCSNHRHLQHALWDSIKSHKLAPLRCDMRIARRQTCGLCQPSSWIMTHLVHQTDGLGELRIAEVGLQEPQQPLQQALWHRQKSRSDEHAGVTMEKTSPMKRNFPPGPTLPAAWNRTKGTGAGLAALSITFTTGSAPGRQASRGSQAPSASPA